MAHLMKKLILLRDIAHLAIQLEANAQHSVLRNLDQFREGRYKESSLNVDVTILASNADHADSFDYSDALSVQSKEKKSLTATARGEIMERLEEWDEPELHGGDDEVCKI